MKRQFIAVSMILCLGSLSLLAEDGNINFTDYDFRKEMKQALTEQMTSMPSESNNPNKEILKKYLDELENTNKSLGSMAKRLIGKIGKDDSEPAIVEDNGYTISCYGHDFDSDIVAKSHLLRLSFELRRLSRNADPKGNYECVSIDGHCIYAEDEPPHAPTKSSTNSFEPSTTKMQPDIETSNKDNPGHIIDITKFLVPGKITIVDFYSEYCGPCTKFLNGTLIPLLEETSIAAVRKVDINREGVRGIDWRSPVMIQQQLNYLPYIIIYDEKGNKIIEGNDAKQFLTDLFRYVIEAQ